MSARSTHGHPCPIYPSLGIGLGLRAAYYAEILEKQPQIDWFEATSENYLGIDGGVGARPLKVLEKIRKNYPVVLHGVSLSIGSTDPLNLDYLSKLKTLAETIQPAFLSDHFCWTGVSGENLHDLLPLPYTEEVIQHLVPRIQKVQDLLGRRMVFENVSSYLTFEHSEMTEWEFITEICKRTDSGILLDVNNIYVSAVNHGFDPLEFLRGIPHDRVAQIHLAGHSKQGGYLIDTHDQPVSEPVWNLFGEAVKIFGPVSSMIERDGNFPDFQEIQKEVSRAESIQNQISTKSREPNAEISAFTP
jgi:uncharacterized protein (UPF0276 family)